VLSTGLLIASAGGAIATADTEAAGSTASSQSADGPSQSTSPAGGPVRSVADTLRKTVQEAVQGVTSTLGSFGKPGQHQSPGAKTPITVPAAADTEYDTKESDLAAAVAGPLASDENVVAPDPNVVASDLNAGEPVANVMASDSNVVAPVPNLPPPATDPATPVSKVVGPVANVVTTVANVVQSVPGLVASLPTSATPVTDVITSVQDMLTSVTNAVIPLTQLPSDLYSLLGIPAVNQPVVGAGSTAGASVLAPRVPQLPQVLPTAGIWEVPFPATAAAGPTPLETIATTGISQELSLSGMTSQAPDGVTPTGVLPFLEHMVDAVLLPASLSALAAVALPGVGGLLIICAAGIRIGYRQAKAGFALQKAGIVRFAGTGPLGVVRSGSLVTLSPRALRVVRPQPSRAACLLDQAA